MWGVGGGREGVFNKNGLNNRNLLYIIDFCTEFYAIKISLNCFIFRRGPEGCGHFGCEYFLSYKRESSLLEIELSGNSTGWVAVGFSSDPNMVSFIM